jgi:hypothetical protein
MRRALTRAFGAALLVLALMVPGRAYAADARPVVRVVLVASADAPPWFDGFVKHLERELGLRGIDVIVARSERDSGTARSASGSSAAADAELVVDAPSALRPVLRFTVQPRQQGATSDATAAGRVRQVNLTGIPADGCALALAVAADELMRSNWSRAVPSEASRSTTGEGKASAEAPRVEGTGASAEGAAPGATKATSDAPTAPAAPGDRETPTVAARTEPSAEGEGSDVAAERGTKSPGDARSFRSSLGVAGAGETFAGGQTHLGADLRFAISIAPRLEVEARGGWRRILRQKTTNGAIDGSALVAGGAIRFLVLRGARANLSLVGRADLLRVVYSGDPRDGSVDATSGSAWGFVVAAGPGARIALTRSLGLEAEVLAGASPRTTTATDAGVAVFATNGAAFLGSLGVSLGL